MSICETLNFTNCSRVLYHYSKLLHKKLCRTSKEVLTLLLRDMVVNPMFPKRSRLAGWAGVWGLGWAWLGSAGLGWAGLGWTGLTD